MRIAFLLVAAALATAAPQRRFPPIDQRIEKIVREFPGTLGVAVKKLDTGESFAVNGEMRFPTASLTRSR